MLGEVASTEQCWPSPPGHQRRQHQRPCGRNRSSASSVSMDRGRSTIVIGSTPSFLSSLTSLLMRSWRWTGSARMGGRARPRRTNLGHESVVRREIWQRVQKILASRCAQMDLERLEARLAVLYDDRLDGRITPEFLDRKAAELREQQERLRPRRKEYQQARLAAYLAAHPAWRSWSSLAKLCTPGARRSPPCGALPATTPSRKAFTPKWKSCSAKPTASAISKTTA
jgi:hypothetical protein